MEVESGVREQGTAYVLSQESLLRIRSRCGFLHREGSGEQKERKGGDVTRLLEVGCGSGPPDGGKGRASRSRGGTSVIFGLLTRANPDFEGRRIGVNEDKTLITNGSYCEQLRRDRDGVQPVLRRFEALGWWWWGERKTIVSADPELL